jgi:hypothetical protein
MTRQHRTGLLIAFPNRRQRSCCVSRRRDHVSPGIRLDDHLVPHHRLPRLEDWSGKMNSYHRLFPDVSSMPVPASACHCLPLWAADVRERDVPRSGGGGGRPQDYAIHATPEHESFETNGIRYNSNTIPARKRRARSAPGSRDCVFFGRRPPRHQQQGVTGHQADE